MKIEKNTFFTEMEKFLHIEDEEEEEQQISYQQDRDYVP